MTLVILAKQIPNEFLPYFGSLALVPALGFLVIYFGGLRKTGIETYGEPIWWGKLRLAHGGLYLIFSYLAINKKKRSYLPLLIDVAVGITAYSLKKNVI